MTIRPFTPEDRDALTELWLRSVRATHTFLSEDDIAFYHPLVHDGLGTMETWVLENASGPLGFMGMDENKVEALFMEPAHAGQGGGRRLMTFAREKTPLETPLLVDVNEDNPNALQFYLRLGFRQTARSPRDGSGRAFPLLHLALDGPLTPPRNR
ncbi:GNAT family N-acetyltransferase [Desulfovibrio sp. OttesenSCG-928-I05]|nr:GNAT family N-acetyltransferase [Desulfovibrio sp. OttesenSCG-928-I05]